MTAFDYQIVVDDTLQVWRLLNLTLGLIAIVWSLTGLLRQWSQMGFAQRLYAEAFMLLMLTVEVAVAEVFLQHAVGGYRVVLVTVTWTFILTGLTYETLRRGSGRSG